MKKPAIILVGVIAIIIIGITGYLLSRATPTLQPKTGPGTDYPCGVDGTVCSNNMCCGSSEACGGSPGCPTGMCCFVGGDDGQMGAHPNHPQVPSNSSDASARKPPPVNQPR